MSSIENNISLVANTIKEAAEKSGRNPEEVRLMAVTKTKPREDVVAAYEAGLTLFGENRVLEAKEKYEGLPEDIELHLIGHLQRNKARQAVETVTWVDSVDKLSTAQAIEKECTKQGKQMNILLEINTSGEESKEGFRSEEQMWSTLDTICDTLPHLTVRGLMTIAPFTNNTDAVRASFQKLRLLFEKLKSTYSQLQIDTLSMGMSSDYTIAIEEGSTVVRIGSLIFGARDYR
jgi:PLP dependent protein